MDGRVGDHDQSEDQAQGDAGVGQAAASQQVGMALDGDVGHPSERHGQDREDQERQVREAERRQDATDDADHRHVADGPVAGQLILDRR